MGQAIQVREGQCYVKVFDSPGCEMRWQVQSVSVQFLSLPHARLVNQDDPHDTRTISCGTIADARYFKLLSEPQPSRAAQAEPADSPADNAKVTADRPPVVVANDAARDRAPRVAPVRQTARPARSEAGGGKLRKMQDLENQIEELAHSVAGM